MKQSDKQFDAHIRSLFDNHEVPFEPEHWSLFEYDLDANAPGDDLLGDDLIEGLRQFKAEPVPGDWEVLSSMLDHEDALEGDRFDHQIKKSVESFEAPYESGTWPILEHKLTAAEIRRRRVLVTKFMEIATFLVLLFTFFNFYPEIRAYIFKNDTDVQPETGFFTDNADARDSDAQSTVYAQHRSVSPIEAGSGAETVTEGEEVVTASSASGNRAGADRPAHDSVHSGMEASRDNPTSGKAHAFRPVPAKLPSAGTSSGWNFTDFTRELVPSVSREALARDEVTSGHRVLPEIIFIKPPIQTLHVPVFDNDAHQKLYSSFSPKLGPNPKKRIGIYASADINVLHFPADNFFSAGEQVTFSAQDLPALGYGGGISLGWFGRRLGFETGIQYSHKSFKPGRQLLIGESLENSKVDFQAVQIDLVTIPLTLTYHVKHTGNLRVYTLAGVGFNLIAQANYDLNIENNYPLPLSITQSASALAANREAHRVREHILDGATFTSKTHVTAFVGIGLENYITPVLSLFVQPSYSHQVPLNGFSTNNGKHFKNLNIRIGARTTIQ